MCAAVKESNFVGVVAGVAYCDLAQVEVRMKYKASIVVWCGRT